jgi:hypothetical protein
VRNILSIDSIANAVRLNRQLKRTTTALLLEGNTDIKFFRNLIDEAKCQIYSVDGKPRVIAVLEILKRDKVPGVLAIIDADTDHIEGKISKHPDVITTEVRDVEGLLLRSPALEKVINEHGGASQFPAQPREVLLSAALPLGYLRCVALRNGWSMNFKILNFGAFINAATIVSDSKSMCEEVLRCNLGFGRTADELLKEIAQITDSRHNKWHVAHGHDMTRILAKAVSFRSKRTFAGDELGSQLRLAFDIASFVATAMFAAICAWQKKNVPFVVIKLTCP